jgi:hypothetical protein
MTQAVLVGRLAGDQSPAIQSFTISALLVAALFVPYAFLLATPALLLMGTHIVRHSPSKVSRNLGWLALGGAGLIVAMIAFAVLVAHGGPFVAGR